MKTTSLLILCLFVYATTACAQPASHVPIDPTGSWALTYQWSGKLPATTEITVYPGDFLWDKLSRFSVGDTQQYIEIYDIIVKTGRSSMDFIILHGCLPRYTSTTANENFAEGVMQCHPDSAYPNDTGTWSAARISREPIHAKPWVNTIYHKRIGND